MSNDEAREEIEGYLLGLTQQQSANLVNVAQFTFVTAQQYSFIETPLDNMGAPVFSRAAVGHIIVRAQWNNAGYYQLYHCDGAAN